VDEGAELTVGILDGKELGANDGTELGIIESVKEGIALGFDDGSLLGITLGTEDGQLPHVALQVWNMADILHLFVAKLTHVLSSVLK